jgi:catechol 2,3-dioxygenase-like lactoylglutathione lyase family enzyme
MVALKHIALFVRDLHAAEVFYQQLFDMALIGRETMLDDGLWSALPADKGWSDALDAGIELGMVALRRGTFVLALFQGDIPPGQVYAIGLSMSSEAIASVGARLPANVQVETDTQSDLVFRDPYRITWQIHTPEHEFLNNGEIAGRWLDV